MHKTGAWKTATIDIDRTAEFTGDDVDQFSSLVDLVDTFNNVEVIIPTVDAGVVSVWRQADGATDTVPTQCVRLSDTQAGHYVPSTTSGTGGITVVFPVGPIQFLRVKVAGNQGADRTIKVRGC